MAQPDIKVPDEGSGVHALEPIDLSARERVAKSGRSELERASETLLKRAPQPEIDEAFISALLDSPGADTAITAHHELKHDKECAGYVDRLTDLIGVFDPLIARLDRQANQTLEALMRTPRNFEIAVPDGSGQPWTMPERARMVGMTATIIGLLAVGMTSLATYMKESGLVALAERPFLAYVLAFMSAPMALVIKEFYSALKDEARVRYRRALFIVGVAMGIAWVVIFAFTVPALGEQGVEDMLAALKQGLRAAQDPLRGPALVSTQVLAEVFFSSFLGIEMKNAFERHAPKAIRKSNPEYHELETALRAQRAEHQAAADARGALLERRRSVIESKRFFVSNAIAALLRAQTRKVEAQYR